jgi:hypothetical protein
MTIRAGVCFLHLRVSMRKSTSIQKSQTDPAIYVRFQTEIASSHEIQSKTNTDITSTITYARQIIEHQHSSSAYA